MVDNKGGGAKAGTGVGTGAGLKSGPGEPGVTKPGLLGALLPYVMALLRAESLSGLLRAAKLHKGFF